MMSGRRRLIFWGAAGASVDISRNLNTAKNAVQSKGRARSASRPRLAACKTALKRSLIIQGSFQFPGRCEPGTARAPGKTVLEQCGDAPVGRRPGGWVEGFAS